MKTRFKQIACLLAITALGGLAATAIASGVHITKAGVQFVADHNNLTLTASGQIAGLGNGAIVTISATADPTTTCTNQGGTAAPGQNPAPIILTGTATVSPDTNGKNGSRPFSVTTDPPTQPTDGTDAGCANDNWTAHIDDLCFTSATLTFQQPDKNGNLVTVFTQTFNFNPCL
jgi:hypothetical protein